MKCFKTCWFEIQLNSCGNNSFSETGVQVTFKSLPLCVHVQACVCVMAYER